MLDYRLENRIYLKDFEEIKEVSSNNVKLDMYLDNAEEANIKLVIKNGNIYIKTEGKRVEVVDENSAVEFVDEHYKKIDKTIYQDYSYDLNKIIDKKYKVKYSSINGFFKSIYSGVKKIANYSILKKILLARILCIWIIYYVCSIKYRRNT